MYENITVNDVIITEDGKEITVTDVKENNDIRGITAYNVKALYIQLENKWVYGKDIAKLNLISLSDRTLEERQKLGSIGGKKAKENRDKKKTFQELAQAMLDKTVTDEQINAVLGENAKDIMEEPNVASLILARMIQGACEGSFKCAEFVRDSSGNKPRNEVELTADVITESDRKLIENLEKRLS